MIKKQQFWRKIWERNEHKRKDEQTNKIRKELEGLEEEPKAKIHFDSLGATLKKNTKSENARPCCYAWIMVIKNHFHP